MDNTTIFNVPNLKQELILITLNEVIEALEYKGYDPTKQIVGYLMTGQLHYITSFNHAREKLAKFNRAELMYAILNGYLGL